MSERSEAEHCAEVLRASPHTFPRALAQALERFSERPWLVFGEEHRTFAEMGVEVAAIARGLISANLEHGDSFGMFLGNRIQWLEAEYAATGVGACVVPINTWFRGRELAHILNTAEVKVLLWDSSVLGVSTLPLLEEVVPELRDAAPGSWHSERFPALSTVIGIGDGPWPRGVIGWDAMLEHGAGTQVDTLEARREAVTPEDRALLMFTSGTTGTPKGAVLSHRAVVDHMAMWVDNLGVTETDRSIIGSPLFWTFGCAMVALTTLLAGSMVALLERFEAFEFLRVMRDHRITHLQGVPTQYEMMLAHPEAPTSDLSALRLIQLGGSTSAEGLARRLLDRAPGARLVSAYGLTEAVAVATWTRPDASLEDVVGTVGAVTPDFEWKLCDPDSGELVPVGGVGELCLRGPSVMLGYVAGPGGQLREPAEGWHHTGDLMRADERGYLRVVGRSVDAFKRGGMNVYPAEAESLLMEHPQIQGVAIVGVPDARLGEAGVAFVVPAPGELPDAEELLAWCSARIARYKVPAHVRFVEALPMTPTGKVTKVGFLARWESGEFANQPEPATT